MQYVAVGLYSPGGMRRSVAVLLEVAYVCACYYSVGVGELDVVPVYPQHVVARFRVYQDGPFAHPLYLSAASWHLPYLLTVHQPHLPGPGFAGQLSMT